MGRFRNAGRGARQVRNIPIGGNGRILKNTARDLCRPSALVKGGRLDSKGVQHDRRKVTDVHDLDGTVLYVFAASGKKVLPFWVWKKDNPYIAGGGMVSNIEDMLRYIALQIESADIFGVSKSTVHNDIRKRLIYIDKNLYEKVSSVLQYHVDIKHIRGGESTKRKFLEKKLYL